MRVQNSKKKGSVVILIFRQNEQLKTHQNVISTKNRDISIYEYFRHDKFIMVAFRGAAN